VIAGQSVQARASLPSFGKAGVMSSAMNFQAWIHNVLFLAQSTGSVKGVTELVKKGERIVAK
jgi:hypothetical protein